MLFPPFEPDQASGRRRFRPVPLRLLVPNMVTLLALAAGLTAIRLAVEGRLADSVLAVAAAAALDGLDGRLARLLKGTSRFGAELDSLADFVSFGCAPALILYFALLAPLTTAGWLGALALAFAAALRLARFNVMIASPERPEWQRSYFVGVPAPAGAMLALLPLTLGLALEPTAPASLAFPVLAWVLAVAALMVSRVPTFSGKGLSGPVPRQRVVPVLAAVLALVALLFSHPFASIAALTILYAASIPVSARRFRLQLGREQGADGLATSPSTAMPSGSSVSPEN